VSSDRSRRRFVQGSAAEAAGSLPQVAWRLRLHLTLGRVRVAAVAATLTDGPIGAVGHPLDAATARRVLADSRGLGLDRGTGGLRAPFFPVRPPGRPSKRSGRRRGTGLDPTTALTPS
jgi:hypothetical protein